ncbi:glycine dehydrogenase subunit 1 [Candidatus Termititenax persephonae]|uniref:Glycine dehydrogenase subunit 1 n=1 Tax=Candidatus Termititenax persephonae TaxID=2218525 RepID=A0A388TF33_9BACT|nr:glycine dehydrogenase subunit 1 [Candidatus Termititenax persephonae]
MAYLPHTESDIQEMLRVIGVQSIADLLGDVPASLRAEGLEEFGSVSEMELMAELDSSPGGQKDAPDTFCGAGRYDHFIPAVVPLLAGRSEFYTAYTPYQPEISQGTLTAIYEFQSMLCELTGLAIANASLYDGATALAEAVNMAVSTTGRREYVVVNLLSPNYRAVLATSLAPRQITEQKEITAQTAAVIFNLPDFHGLLSDWQPALNQAKASGALLIVCADPLLLSVLEPPRADIIVGEAQPLGNPQNFGGPALGYLAARQDFLRQMPGRIVGRTVDSKGRRSFVLTMQTREQHIRREKATSNICSNQALCALRAVIHMSYLGRSGLQTVAKLCKAHTDYAKQKLGGLPGFAVEQGEHFRDFVLHCPLSVKKLNIGLALTDKCLLLSVTEKNTRQQIDLLAEKLRGLGEAA